MKVNRTSYYLISGNDRAGEAANLLNKLKQNNIDLDAIWGYGTPSGRSEIYLVPKNPSQFQNAAAKIGLNYTEGTCFRVTGPDEVGSLTSTMDEIARQEINISALNATAINGQVGAYIWCKPDDVDKLSKALGV